MNEIYYCPIDDFTCPYFNKEKMICTIDNPLEECDEYYDFSEEDIDIRPKLMV